MICLGKVYENLMVDLQTRSDKLAARATRIVRTLTGASEREAGRALRISGHRAKTAIVMIRRGVSRAEAEQLLARHGGFLRPVLEG